MEGVGSVVVHIVVEIVVVVDVVVAVGNIVAGGMVAGVRIRRIRTVDGVERTCRAVASYVVVVVVGTEHVLRGVHVVVAA